MDGHTDGLTRKAVTIPDTNKRLYASNSVPYTGLSDKGRAIKCLVVCNDWDLGLLKMLNGLALGCYQPSSEVLIVCNQ